MYPSDTVPIYLVSFSRSSKNAQLMQEGVQNMRYEGAPSSSAVYAFFRIIADFSPSYKQHYITQAID